jgi:hypothetical protein
MENKNKFTLHRDTLISWEILESEAFKSLSAKGIRVLIRFLQKRTWSKARRTKKLIFDDRRLSFTYAEAAIMGISTSQFCTVLKKLIAIGFIDIEHQGGIHKNDFSLFAISERWRSFGTNDFVEVKKPRVLWKGHDVRSWMRKKDATENRSEPLRETVAIEGN